MSDPSDKQAAPFRFVEVALPLPPRQTFTYVLPPDISESIQLGARVLVPFGKRMLTGYAVALHKNLDADLGLQEKELKSVSELLDRSPLISDEILALTKWAADYYAASWGEMLKASLPAGINAAVEQVIQITEAGRDEVLRVVNLKPVRAQILKRLEATGEISRKDLEKEYGRSPVRRALREMLAASHAIVSERAVAEKVKPKRRKAVRLLNDEPEASLGKPLSDVQQRIVTSLKENGGQMMFTELLEKAKSGASSISTLEKRGAVEIVAQEVLRDPFAGTLALSRSDILLNSEQSFVLGEIELPLAERRYSGFLLHGVTGSGKTEVYMRAMQKALSMGRSSLMLVPEIALTPVFSRRLRSMFGSDVAILHSNLSQGERFDEWRRIRRGDARIVIGTRSAVFAPLDDVGLLIVDEEHDTSYRQHESPFYNARDVAVMRANQSGAVVVLGSATPSLESYHNAQSGKYRYLQLQNRIGNVPLAQAELIDMREVFRQTGKDVVLSPQLIQAIEETHSKGEQSIILLNRRGFSQFVLCRSCGERLRCKNCDITLTYHRREARLVCHYCAFTAKPPDRCPFCDSEYLYFIGQGTEQIEDILRRRFPELSICRIDRDTMTKRGQIDKTLLAFDSGEIDMLVGTQMLAKGHDFHNVTLVGVISVDIGLGLPDFRSAERTFQLLTQVAGRAGRGNLPGRVLIQTYYPEHYALRYACEQDYEGFFNEEIRFRSRLNYPPFVVLASILIRHPDYEMADRIANIVKTSLDAANREKACRVLGVAPASIARLKGEYRMQILVKSTSRRSLRETLEIGLHLAEQNGAEMRHVYTDIDPVNLM